MKTISAEQAVAAIEEFFERDAKEGYDVLIAAIAALPEANAWRDMKVIGYVNPANVDKNMMAISSTRLHDKQVPLCIPTPKPHERQGDVK